MTARAVVRSMLQLARETPGLRTSDVAVLAVIASHANHAGHAYPSLETIAATAKVSADTVARRVRVLEGRGLLTVLRTEGRVNRYRLPVTFPMAVIPNQPQTGDGPAANGHRTSRTTSVNQPHYRGTKDRRMLEGRDPTHDGRCVCPRCRQSTEGTG